MDIKRAVRGRLVGGRFIPNPKKSAIEEVLYKKFRKDGYSRSEAKRFAKINAPYFGAPRSSNLSHRKSKKEFKAARAALGIQAGLSPRISKKEARSARYRGDSRKYGPTAKSRGQKLFPAYGKKKNPKSKQWRVKKSKDYTGKVIYLVTKGPSHTFGGFWKREEAEKRADELNYGPSPYKGLGKLVKNPQTGYYVWVGGKKYKFRSLDRARAFYNKRERQLGRAVVQLVDAASGKTLAGGRG